MKHVDSESEEESIDQEDAAARPEVAQMDLDLKFGDMQKDICDGNQKQN